MESTIIEVALSGFGGKSRNIHNPITPEEIAADIVACIRAGAGIVHNHIDDYRAAGTAAAARYGEGWKAALAEYPDAILYATLAAAPEGAELGQYAHILETITAHGARMGVLDTGSLNLSGGSDDGQPNTGLQIVYANSYVTIDKVLKTYAAHKVPSSIAIYDPTFLRATLAYHRAGRLMPGTFVKLYFGGERTYLDGKAGVSFGLPPTLKALDAYLEMIEGSGLVWGAAVLGGDILAHKDFVRAVLERGGHLRVGLEDYAGDRNPGNAELVAEAADLARRVGRPPADSREAARLLGMPAKPI